MSNKPEGGPKVHLLGHYSNSMTVNATQFAKDARQIIKDIHSRDKIPILEGGATFYL